jgi:hypothetical protein
MRAGLAGLLLIGAGIWYAASRSTAGDGPLPPAVPAVAPAFSFAVLGDAPYFPWEDDKYRRVLREMDAAPLGFVLHVGDILWKPCDDERYARALRDFDGLKHPVIYTPGDNEWADCGDADAGGFAPLERLARLRQIFFRVPTESLGTRRIALVSQSSQPGYEEFVENVRWVHDGVVFATVHVVGSANGAERSRDRTAAAREARHRIDAAAAWVRRAFAAAAEARAPAVVVALHANPYFERRGAPQRRPYEPFIAALEAEAARFAGPVLVTHGDHHEYVVDRPLTRQSGEPLDNVTRMQVPGSPIVGWVRVSVAPGAGETFTFEARTIPVWQW